MPTSTNRQGFTLIELLVVISIIAILAGLLLPAVTLVKNKANQTANGNSQKQIVTAMIAYQGDYDGAWPCAWYVADVGAATVADITKSKLITHASYETLSAATALPNAIFKAKGQTQAAVTGVAKLWTDSAAFDASNWSFRGTGGTAAWSYDWSAPSDVASYRIIMADRANWHKAKVLGIAADSSLKLFSTASGTAESYGMTGTTIVVTAMGGTQNGDAVGGGASGEFVITAPNNGDSIYASTADGTIANGAGVAGNTMVGDGDNRRAFVK